jgi:threonine/homoserine/homoserine lactone efflux protein
MSRALPASLTFPVIFGVAFATGFTGAVVPGSLLAVVVSKTLQVGWLAGPVMMVGHALLELVAAALLATGVIYFARHRWVQGSIGLAGGAVLVYLGYLTFQVSGVEAARALGGASAAGGPSTGGWLGLIGLGAVMSVVNPYWWLWWATICPAHMTWALRRGRAGGGVYYVGHILSDIVWYSAVSLALATGRSLLSAGVLQGIYVGAAVLLIVMGLMFVVFGGKTLRRREAPAAVEA